MPLRNSTEVTTNQQNAADNSNDNSHLAQWREHKTTDLASELHYSIQELAARWKLSEKTVRKLFENEPGVIQIGSKEGRFRRAYVTRRIPESVALRVHRRLRKSA